MPATLGLRVRLSKQGRSRLNEAEARMSGEEGSGSLVEEVQTGGSLRYNTVMTALHTRPLEHTRTRARANTRRHCDPDARKLQADAH